MWLAYKGPCIPPPPRPLCTWQERGWTAMSLCWGLQLEELFGNPEEHAFHRFMILEPSV